ncbi:MAG: InlB B-repeat-containing protein [Bacteroidales bacterium]|nr:InlB B-repeat-containing protein [Bacteroidales bacterium]MBR7035298.1 InlB B-repeat-containing protein [Bacteroidales bacterium]
MRKILLFVSSVLISFGLYAQERLKFSELAIQLSVTDFVLKNTETGTEEGQFSEDLYTQLSEVNIAAIAMQQNAETQSDIDDMVGILDNAIREYAASVVSSSTSEFDIDALSDEVTVATWLLSASKAGTKQGQFPQEQYNELYNIKQDAKSALKYAESQSEIDENYQTLVAAEESFKASVYEEDVVIAPTYDNSLLSQAIDKATLLLESTTYGTEVGQYSVTEYMNLSKATESAKTILAKSNKQSEIDKEEAALTKAIQTYTDTKVTEETYVKPDSPYNVGQLSSKIETANYYLDNTTYGTNVGQYPIAQYKNLLAETEKAKDLLTSAQSQSEIDAQTSVLGQTIDEYVESKLTESLPPQYDETFDINVMVNNENYGKTYGSGSYSKRNVRIIASPASGYHFVKWEDGNEDNPREIMVTKDEVYMAVFEKNTDPVTDSTLYTINAVSIDDQLGLVLGSSKNIAYGTKITLIAQVSFDGYHFAGWSDGNTENPRQLTVTEDKVIVALFENGSTAIEDPIVENDIQIIQRQIVMNGETPAYVYDILGRKIANKNLSQGVYLVSMNGKTARVFIQ